MRRTILFSIILLRFFNGFAQSNVSVDHSQYGGDTVTISGRIYAGKYLTHVITKPTFLNLYDSSPLHMLMIRIDSSDRKNFPEEPEKLYLNKQITVRGVLGDYKGVSLIKIVNPSAVSVDMNDKGPQPIAVTGSYMTGHEFGYGKSDSIFRKTQDSVAKILAADTSRRRKIVLPTVQQPALSNNGVSNKTGQPGNPSSTIDSQKAVVPEPAKMEQPVVEKPVSTIDTPQTVNAPVIDPKPVEETKTTEKESTEPVVLKSETEAKPEEEDKPEVVKQVRLKNIPVIKATNAANNDKSDTSAKATWLKTISNQEFEAVNEKRFVKDGEIEMRTSPNMDAPVLAYLMKKMEIHITYRSKRWSYVTVENPDGTLGLSGFIKNKVYKNLVEKAE